MAGTRTERADKDRKNERERQRYRKSADLPPEELEMRRAQQAAYMRDYMARNREEYNAKRFAYAKERAKQKRLEVLEALGNQCSVCRMPDWRVLQVDHVNGGGRAHRKRSGSGYHYWQTVLDRIDEFQLLCANCHVIKSYHGEDYVMVAPAAALLALSGDGGLPSGS